MGEALLDICPPVCGVPPYMPAAVPVPPPPPLLGVGADMGMPCRQTDRAGAGWRWGKGLVITT